jgi:hypothetical protein
MLTLWQLWFEIFHSIIYVVLWIVLFGLSIYTVSKCSKWSLHKELIEDQNIALWIMFAWFFIALAIIIAAAIFG